MAHPGKLFSTVVMAACIGVAAAPGVPLVARQQVPVPATPRADFTGDIQPILEAHCYECHGPKKARGQLRLDRKSSVFSGGMSGPSIAPGDSENSVIVRRLLGLDGEDRMPLDKDPLPEAQIALIRRWIDQGAAWPDTPGEATAAPPSRPAQHWAYVKPVRHAPPAVRERGMGAHAHRSLRSRAAGGRRLAPSPEASREALLRRVSLDLVGLPPTPAEIDAFLADTSPGAYERVVDRLLASPHYGERWARPWLDLARYADSNGYEKDAPAHDVEVPRLGDRRAQPRHAVRPVHHRADRRRHAAERHARPADRHRLPSQHAAQPGRRHRRRGGAVGDARRSRQHDRRRLARARRSAARSATTTSTTRSRSATTTGCSPSSTTATTRCVGQAGRRSLDCGAAARPSDARSRRRSERRCRRSSTPFKEQLDAPGAEIDAAQGEWERSMLAADRAWTPLDPADAARHARHGAVAAARRLDSRQRDRRRRPSPTPYARRRACRESPASASRCCPTPSLPQGGPGRDYYGNFVLTGFTVTAAPAAPACDRRAGHARRGARRRRFGSSDLRDLLMKPAVDNGDLPAGWAIDATRDAARLRRQAVFMPGGAGGLAGGAALTMTLSFHGTAVSQALGRFRLSVTGDDDPMRVVGIRAKTRAALELPRGRRSEDQKKARDRGVPRAGARPGAAAESAPRSCRRRSRT